MNRQLLSRPVAVLFAAAAVSSVQAQSLPRPAVPPVAPFRFPATRVHTLANGMRLVVAEDHAIPVVAVRVVMQVDSLADPIGKEGLFNVTMGALREGTTTRTVDQLSAASSAIGTPVSPTAFTTTTDAFAPALAILGDMLMHPSFDSVGVIRRRAAQAAFARSLQEIPGAAARNDFYSLVLGRENPATRAYYATPASVNSITRQDVLKFYESNFAPNVATIIVSGDITDAGAFAAVTHVFEGWTAREVVARGSSAAHPPVAPTTIYIVDQPDTASWIFLGNTLPPRTDSTWFAADVAGQIGATRFTQALRDKRSLMYSGSQTIQWLPAPRRSVLLGLTLVRTSKIDSALVAWMSVMRGLHGAQPVTAAELEAARRARLGPLPTRIDGPDNVADRLRDAVRDNLAPDYLSQYAAGVAAAAVADVSSAAERYIDPDHLIIVVSGDRTVLEPALRAANIAPVVVVDANGKIIP